MTTRDIVTIGLYWLVFSSVVVWAALRPASDDLTASSATLRSSSFLRRRRIAPTPCRATELGTRTGQGRQPRSGRALARALTRSIPSPPAEGGIVLRD